MSRLVAMLRRLFVRTPTTTPLSLYADSYVFVRGLSVVVDMPGLYSVYTLDEYDYAYELVADRLAHLHAQGVVGVRS